MAPGLELTGCVVSQVPRRIGQKLEDIRVEHNEALLDGIAVGWLLVVSEIHFFVKGAPHDYLRNYFGTDDDSSHIPSTVNSSLYPHQKWFASLK